MKNFTTTKAVSWVTIVALSLTVACRSTPEELVDNPSVTSDGRKIEPMPADMIANQPSIVAKVTVDGNGNITSVEKRQIPNSTPHFANVSEAANAFDNAATGTYTEDTSSDSYYVNGLGGYGAFGTNTNLNYNTAWQGYNYNSPGFNNNVLNNNLVNNNIINNNTGFGANVYGCGNYGYGCYNYAYSIWPSVFSIVNAGLNIYYGYKYANSFGYYRGCGSNCGNYFYRW